MGTYNSAVITTAGQSLLARAIADNLPFYMTSAKTTEYVVPTGTSAVSLTELPNVKQSDDITSATVSGGNKVATSVRFDNTEITLNYSINTIGVYARVGTDTEETLLAVITAITADVMPSYSAANPVSYVYSINLAISNASNINIIVAPTGVPNYAEFNELSAEVEALDAEVQNARIGADGVTYPTLGDAIRTNDSALKSHLDENIPLVNWLYTLYPLFEQKAWNASQQAFVASSAQVSLTTITYADEGLTIRVREGARYQVHKWASTSASAPTSITGWQTGQYIIHAGEYFTIGMNITDGTPTNLTTFRKYLYGDSVVTVEENLQDFIEVASPDALYSYYSQFMQKRYDVSNHIWVDSTYTLSNTVPLVLSDDITVRAKDGYQFIVLFWASTDTSGGFSGTSGGTKTQYTIPKDRYFTISATKIYGGTITNIKDCIYCDNLADFKAEQDLDIRTSNLYSTFAKVGVIGDSYSAVRLYYYDRLNALQSAGDVPFYSWGKFMERKSGMSYNIFAKGGLEASQWLTDADVGYPVASQASNLCQCYIIGLGINDSSRHDTSYIGTISDINSSDPDQNANSFIGNYAKIIQKMSALVNGAKFFVMTMGYYTSPSNQNTYLAYNDAIRAIADYFDDVYLIDLNAKYYEQYADANGFFAINTINGHFTPTAYQYVAELVSYEMSKIMYENPDDFKLIEFINKVDGSYWTNQ